jgi:PIN like domain
VLFLDATHQSKLTAKLLRDLDVNVEVHRRHYRPSAPDPEWIADATKRGWVIISGDKGIRDDGVNRHAVIKARAKVFLLADTNSRGAEWAASLVMARKKILRIADQNNGPFYCVVEKGTEHHVHKPEFFEEGGPIPPSPITQSQIAAPMPSESDAEATLPPAAQSKIPWPEN